MNKDELLENYFSRELTTEEQISFENLIANDDEFKEDFDFQLDLKEAIKNKERSKLKEKLHSYEASINKKNKGGFNWSQLSIAASIVLLLGIGWIGFKNISGVNYDDYYNQYPNTVVNITRSDSDQTIERKAFVAYESGDLVSAIKYFNELKRDKSIEYLNFYLGQSYLKQNNFKKAIEYFEQNIEEDKVFVAESHWYIALSYLKNKDKTSAKEHLEKLIADYEYMNSEAKVLLEDIN